MKKAAIMMFHSSIEPLYYVLPLIGLVVGLFGTMLGGGGGFFFLPVLTILLKVPAQTAVITSLVATVPICLVGSLSHYRRNNIDFRLAAIFAVSGIAGAFAGAGITSLVSSAQLKVSFGIYAVLIALHLAYHTWQGEDAEATGNKAPAGTLKSAKGSFYGLFAGIITGTFGTSGTAPVLAGLFSMHIPVKMVIGTSLLIVMVNTLFATGAHFLIGRIDLTLVYFLTSGSAIGALAGPGILAKIRTDRSGNRIRYGYAAVMLALGIIMVVS